MIKAPITKTGEIRYIEFIKIFVLVSFFIAFITRVSEQPQFLVQISPVITVNVLNIFIMIVLSVHLAKELRELLLTVKSFVVTLVPVYCINLKQKFMEVIIPFISIATPDLLQSKLCVVRC